MILRHYISAVLLCILGFQTSAQETVTRKLDCSSHYDEYAPVVYEESLVFCSDRKMSISQTVLDPRGKHHSSIYSIPLDKLESKADPTLFSSQLTSVMHEGPMCFSSDRMTMYFTANLDKTPKSDDPNSLGIFYSILTEDSWSDPQPFEFNSPDGSYDVAHPALSPNGTTLIFSSNMPGGLGEADLYQCHWNGMYWSKPENLGKSINSAFSDLFPCFDQKDRLYFSSNRNPETGLDIYKFEIHEMNTGAEVKLLDAPVNGPFDDFGIYTSDGTSGFFASNREGNDDLFGFQQSFPEFKDCNEVVDPFLCYLIEEEQIIPNDTLPLVYEWDFGDGTTAQGLSAEHCFPGVGTYDVALNLFDTISNFQYARVAEIQIEIDYPTQPFITGPDSLKIGEAAEFTHEGTNLPGVEILEYYWNYGLGSDQLGPSTLCSFYEPGVQRVTMGLFARDSFGDTLKVCAYRDIVVVDPDLLVLENEMAVTQFEKPVENLLNELSTIDHPVDSSLYYVEFRQSLEQIALNDPYFEKVDYEITERFLENEAIFSYSVGEADEIFKLYAIYRELIDSGYTETLVKEQELEDFRLDVVRKGTYVPDSIKAAIHREINKFANIHFGNSKFDIRTESYANLDHVVSVLEREPMMRLKIHAFTDNIGSEEFNSELSQMRAKSVKQYLINNGIEEERIEWQGHGNSEPVASNDTESGRAMNRRVEFEILFEEILKN
jgi:outer membrane protein OmpA-like peptidoglycan-associated protein